MASAIAGSLLVFVAVMLFWVHERLGRLEKTVVGMDERANRDPYAHDLVIELRCHAIMGHPACAAYYTPILERAQRKELVLPGPGRPLIRENEFRLLFNIAAKLWSDFHKTFLDKFQVRGRILNVEGDLLLSEEPTLWVRLHEGSVQLFILEGGFKLDRKPMTPITTFPLAPLFDLGRAEEGEELRDSVALLVRQLKVLGFKWCTEGRGDVHQDATGEWVAYDPDDGYLVFANTWIRVRYKQTSSFWSAIHLSDEVKETLAELGTEAPWADDSESSERGGRAERHP